MKVLVISVPLQGRELKKTLSFFFQLVQYIFSRNITQIDAKVHKNIFAEGFRHNFKMRFDLFLKISASRSSWSLSDKPLWYFTSILIKILSKSINKSISTSDYIFYQCKTSLILQKLLQTIFYSDNLRALDNLNTDTAFYDTFCAAFSQKFFVYKFFVLNRHTQPSYAIIQVQNIIFAAQSR